MFYFNSEYSHCILKTPKPNDFRVQEEHGGRIINVEPSPDLMSRAESVLRAIDRTLLYTRVDLVKDDKGDYALMELELIEPSLYLRMDPGAPKRFAHAVQELIN